MKILLVRDGSILGPVEDYGIMLGSARWSISRDRSTFEANLIARGDLRLGDWLQIVDEDGVYLGRYKYWGSRAIWAGVFTESLELRSSDGVLDLAQVWQPGPLSGTSGDAIRGGQPLIATAQDIAEDLGLQFSSPTLDLVAVSDYGWDIGTPLSEVIDDILAACNLSWIPGRQGEVYVYVPPTSPTSIIDSGDVIALEIEPLWEQVANVVTVVRGVASHNTPAVGAIAIWDDPTSITSIQRLGPRIREVEAGPVAENIITTRAEMELSSLHRLGGEIDFQISWRNDVWPGEMIHMTGISELGEFDVLVLGIEYEQGRSTVSITGKITELDLWAD